MVKEHWIYGYGKEEMVQKKAIFVWANQWSLSLGGA